MSKPETEAESFLARWSRLKRSEPGKDDQAAPVSPTPPDRVAARQEPPPQPRELATLPRIEDLTAASDVTAFLQHGVPAELRQLALRKAWTLDPAIRDFIEVAENQYNWNVPDGVPGFGELPPGTDIAALLDQATGKLPPREEPPVPAKQKDDPAVAEVTIAPEPSPGPQDGPAALGQHGYAPSITDAEQTSRVVATPQPGGDLAGPDPAAAGQPRTRRRHGGALPRLDDGPSRS